MPDYSISIPESIIQAVDQKRFQVSRSKYISQLLAASLNKETTK